MHARLHPLLATPTLTSSMDVYEKAKALLSAGQLEKSYQLYNQFIDSHKESREYTAAVTDAYNSRGHIKYLWVDFPGATEDYSQAIARDPSFATAHYNRGQVKYRIGETGWKLFGVYSVIFSS